MRAEAPRVVVVLVGPGRYAAVFGIEADKVHPDGGLLELQLTRQFQHDAHAAGPVVGSQNGGFVVLFVGVVIRPRPAVPVGAYQDAAGGLGVDRGDDVGHVIDGAVPAAGVGLLQGDFGTIVAEFLRNVFAALVVGFGVHDARPEGALCLQRVHGRVGAEGGHGVGRRFFSCRSRFLLTGGQRQNEQRT